MNNTEFDKWFDTFLEEKNLPSVEWEIDDDMGFTNFINSDVIIETIKGTTLSEKIKIKDMIVKIDFVNGDVNDYFKHLARGLVNHM